ncbi:uncharacterized protein EI90DRAFT_2328886 [Cantharellus anzutake]|uniref:uncharacterized protein n=1 Tax=Cantharellus anzutake TaxID=1750568 RepID=UPI001906A840|nr:uncharacterized protein EI90DRAFT_2328886 [Cantharellus anzutake]KAF8324596.1 hypothetical protein EI90DRAFT_2328886 [Cantharellus anzutake]
MTLMMLRAARSIVAFYFLRATTVVHACSCYRTRSRLQLFFFSVYRVTARHKSCASFLAQNPYIFIQSIVLLPLIGITLSVQSASLFRIRIKLKPTTASERASRSIGESYDPHISPSLLFLPAWQVDCASGRLGRVYNLRFMPIE